MVENATRPNTNLPASLTTFIGREKLVDEIERVVVMEPPECRLLTLTGAGGTGKTRAALHVARAVADRFDDGVYVVLLAPVTDAKLVSPQLRRRLGCPSSANGHLSTA